MFCAKCGSQVNEGSRFCQSCGAEATAASNPLESVSQQGSYPQQRAPYPQQGAPYPQQGAPYPQQGAPYPQQGAPYPLQGSPNLQQGAPYPAPPMQGNGPYPQNGSYPQAGPYSGMPMQVTLKKKKHVGCFVSLILVVLIGAGIFWAVGSIGLFQPKNIGVNPQKEDFLSVQNKMGTQVTAQIRSADLGDSLKDVLAAGGVEKNVNGESVIEMDNTVMAELFGKNKTITKLKISDYNWEFSDYQLKQFTVTDQEASAFFNNIAPAFWWFNSTQIKLENGKIITSSQLDIEAVVNAMFSDVAGQIPIPLPGKANLYTEGDISIHNNHISMQPDVFTIGPIPLPDEYKTPEKSELIAGYLDRFITIIPGLEINDIHQDSGGVFNVDAVIPQKVVVTPK